MAEAPPPATAPAPGSIFENYDPTGALGGMFAPAFIKGFAPSEKAVAAWQAEYRPGQEIIEQSRMPNLYVPPGDNPLVGVDGVYSAGVPQKQSYGDPRGMVDPAALLAASQGGKYDIEARRSSIAARLAENARLQAPAALAPPTGDGSAMATMSPDEYRRRIIGDHSGYWGEG